VPFLWQVIASSLNLEDTSPSYEKGVGLLVIESDVFKHGEKSSFLKHFFICCIVICNSKNFKREADEGIIKIKLFILGCYSLSKFARIPSVSGSL